MKPAPWPGSYHPTSFPRKVATSAPATPRTVVRTKPMFSLPGKTTWATTPARKPTMIVQIRPMAPSFSPSPARTLVSGRRRQRRFPSLRTVEHHPHDEVVGEVLEPMLLVCGHEEHVSRTEPLDLLAVSELAAPLDDDVD